MTVYCRVVSNLIFSLPLGKEIFYCLLQGGVQFNLFTAARNSLCTTDTTREKKMESLQ